MNYNSNYDKQQGFSASQQHLAEWITGSAVNAELAQLNVQSVSGPDIFPLLNPNPDRINTGRLNAEYHRRYDRCEGSSGWWFANVDPLTEEETGWGQFKADPGCPLSHNGKTGEDREPIKYQSPKGIPTEPIILKVPEKFTRKLAKLYDIKYKGQTYYELILANPQIPLFITEGAKKAASLISQGLPAIGIVGVHNWGIKDKSGNKQLHPTLNVFCDQRTIYLCFDRDPVTVTKIMVRKAVEKLALALKDSEVYICYPPTQGTLKVGIDDYFASGGKASELKGRASSFKDWKDPFKSKYLNAALNHLQDYAGNRIRLNLRSSEIEFDGVPIDANTFRLDFSRKVLNHPLSLDRFQEIISIIAKENAYDPIKDYFDSLPNENDYDLMEVAVKYFGAKPGSIECVEVKKWLISAVARTLQPGCKADSALILYESKGGVGKSTWFKKLCPDPIYFCDDMGNVTCKDEKLKMHQHFIIEWAELDGIFGMKASSHIKSFLAAATDNIRVPYGRASERRPRRSIICGTTNKREVLPESSGQRRYWIVEVFGKIDTALLEWERDLIWTAAKQAYLAGEQWWLTEAEQQESDKSLSAHQMPQPYEEEIEEFLAEMERKGRDRFKASEVKDFVNPYNKSPQFSGQIKRYLESVGYYNKTYRDGSGTKVRGYIKKTNILREVANDTSSSVPNESFCSRVPPSPEGSSSVSESTAGTEEQNHLFQSTDKGSSHWNSGTDVSEKNLKNEFLITNKNSSQTKNLESCSTVPNPSNPVSDDGTDGFENPVSSVPSVPADSVLQNGNTTESAPKTPTPNQVRLDLKEAFDSEGSSLVNLEDFTNQYSEPQEAQFYVEHLEKYGFVKVSDGRIHNIKLAGN